MNLIVDIGNTQAKIAIYQAQQLVAQQKTSHAELNAAISALLIKHPVKAGIISSVGTLAKETVVAVRSIPHVIWLNAETKVPFNNLYQTPKTLGVDRIALVSAATNQFKGQHVLIIDAGTCITYDFVTAEKNYLGGAISPGIKIRYKALNDYTANLPLLQLDAYELIGKNTEQSIHSGVLNGVVQEIEGIIAQYSLKYSNLTVVLTGGDTIFLSKMLKSSIFAIPNFLLEGLNRILIHNLDE